MYMTSFREKKSVTLKIVYIEKKIQIFVINMPFISSREARNVYFLMKYAFFASLDEINGIFIPKI